MEAVRRHLTPANVMSTLAAFVAVAGSTAYASEHLGGDPVGAARPTKDSVMGPKAHGGALGGGAIAVAALGTAPSAKAPAVAKSAAPPGAHREVGAAGEPRYEGSPTFADGKPPVFWMNREGVVHLEGGLVSTVAGVSELFTLPLAYQPAEPLYFRGVSAVAGNEVSVGEDGIVTSDFAAKGEDVSLDGITWRVRG